MTNPISATARAWLYVVGIVVGALAVVGTAAMTVVGLTEWLPVLTAAVSALTVICSSLARANLSGLDAPAAAVTDYAASVAEGMPERAISEEEEEPSETAETTSQVDPKES